MQQVHAAAEESRAAGLDHHQRGTDGHGGVERIAALRAALHRRPPWPADARWRWLPCPAPSARAPVRGCGYRNCDSSSSAHMRAPRDHRDDSGRRGLMARASSCAARRPPSGDELRDVAAIGRDLADQRRGDERELFLRREEHRLDVARQVARHVGQLELEFEVRHGAQAAHHHLDVPLAREVDGQPGVAAPLPHWGCRPAPAAPGRRALPAVNIGVLPGFAPSPPARARRCQPPGAPGPCGRW